MSTLAQLLQSAKASPVFRRSKFLAAADHEFIRALVSWRERRGLKQDEIAERMGVSQQAVSKFERYDGDPKLSTIRRYANALSLVVSHEIADDEGEKVSAPADNWASGSAGFLHIAFTTTPQGGATRASMAHGYAAANAKRTDFALIA